ncbi:MAG TPA: sulfatase/phosphatase domain-containing protein, partial [Propionibacteriaceae bacterium]|nr:sulfatase/phosphatase domain-containing protein [Propionibacteriaceae bacterium]
FEQSLQMPVLVRWPSQIPAGSRCEAMITNVDFAVTFLDMCGIGADALPAQQGRSFLDLLKGESFDDWPRSMYYRYWEHDDPHHHVPAHYGVRTERYKLIRYYGAPLGVPGSSDRITPDEWEMFDLERDPQELTNVIDDPSYQDVRHELMAELDRLQGLYGDLPYDGPQTPHPDWGDGLQEHS